MPAPPSCGSPQPLLLSWMAAAVAVAAAVLLWGVGAEAMYFGHRLSGGFLLADAAIVSALEAATIGCLVMLRTGGCSGRCGCRQLERLTAAVDNYRRAIAYALLTVPCFVQLNRYWLPAVPGGALIFSALFYAIKHCCSRKVPYDFGKMPTFVRFEDDSFLAPELLPSSAGQNIYQPASWSASVVESSAQPPPPPPRPQPQPQPQPPSTTSSSPPPPPPRCRRQLLDTGDKQRLIS